MKNDFIKNNGNDKVAAITICAVNYMARALVCRETFLEFHQDCRFYILLVGDKNKKIEEALPGVDLIWVEDLEIPGFKRYAFMYDVIELCTNVKPTAILTLLKSYKKVIYLDPDIGVYAKLDPVIDALDNASITVTPHSLTPLDDGHSPSDIDFSRFGSYNLGFVAVSQCNEAFDFLTWWSERCLSLGLYEPQSGMAVDQKWVDLAPSYFPNLKIMRLPGLNVAFWNLHERVLSIKENKWKVNATEPLYFFHFSSFNPSDPDAIAEKQDRFSRGQREDIVPLFRQYATQLLSKVNKEFSQIPYSYDYFDNGDYILPLTRRVFYTFSNDFDEANPFSEDGIFKFWARKRRLVSKKYSPAKRQTFKDLPKFSRQTQLIGMGLKSILSMIGPVGYWSFLRYLAHVSSVRNQKHIFKKVK